MSPNLIWCPYKRRKLAHKYTQREDHVKTQGNCGHREARERERDPSEETNHADTLVSGF